LRYNEAKHEQKKAELVHANRFVKDMDKLSQDEKLYHFERLTSLNERVGKNTVHISISFFPEDKLSDLAMQKLVVEYMGKIGFERQPFLVYRHNDTRHPHFHIVSTNIRSDGSRIELRHIMRNGSQNITQ
jgi:hypothetical protein